MCVEKRPVYPESRHDLIKAYYPLDARPLFAVAFLMGDVAKSQVKGQSPGSLIRFLAYQDDRPGRMAALAGMSGRGLVKENRSAANALSKAVSLQR